MNTTNPKSAIVRAAIISHISSFGRCSRGALVSALKPVFEEHDINVNYTDNILNGMMKAGSIEREDGEYKLSEHFAYNGDSSETTQKPRGKYKPKAKALPSITMDVVKDTGRVRLTINGLIIEIGVV